MPDIDRDELEPGQVWLTRPLDPEFEHRTAVIALTKIPEEADDVVGTVLESWRAGGEGNTVAQDPRTLVARMYHREPDAEE